MRLRNVKNKKEILESCPYVIMNPISYFGKWQDVFQNENPIYIEIGMGKGKFLVENAISNPNINFIGIEKYDSVLARGIPKIPEGISNLKIIRMDALEIDQVFSHEISRIYLNFSDPWPKVRHHSRRLSSTIFLKKYDCIFKDCCEIYMRTDNQDFYIYSLESFTKYGYFLDEISFDLHACFDFSSPTTEYEDKFSAQGMPIYFVIAKKKSVQNSKDEENNLPFTKSLV